MEKENPHEIPMVSICCLTYNHEKYVKQALDGFLMQKTNFPFEIVIHDDASTDNTANIIREYADKHPDVFKPLLQTENQRSKFGGGMNPRFNFPRVKGKYIAICEGDDYWTDPYKLQKQVDFLENNQEYVLCFHEVKILKPDGELVADYITKVPENYQMQEDFARYGNYIHAPSVLFKNVIETFPESFWKTPVGDFFIYMLVTNYGKMIKLNDVMSVYRAGSGVWSTQSAYPKNFRTAYAHALIIESMEENKKVVQALLERIRLFLLRFYENITVDDLKKLTTTPEVQQVVYESLQEIIQEKDRLLEKEKENHVDNVATKHLITKLFKQVKKKIWKSR
ncbi:hypothetical protein DI487_03590 [Flavobacterium sediminis]|uniref:Glycosyltransferase 2-like domain-containing protein n=1 Tax=Flavobacterium sediminis TaxID=2201181 RepID=A0A2U8QT67_9FLAO|nr:glycosyltransferase [Flavobacterium sediminis]AWM13035.1 hypothetical protein DI487_03590 [Flavobacterium sediminis]